MKRILILVAAVIFAGTMSAPANTQVSQGFKLNESLELNESTGNGGPDCFVGYHPVCHTECRADGSGYCVPVQVCSCVPD